MNAGSCPLALHLEGLTRSHLFLLLLHCRLSL